MKHEKGCGCFMDPKSGVGLGRLKMKHEKGFGCFSWFLRVGWEGAPTTHLGTIFSLPRPFPDPFMLCQVCLVKYRFAEREHVSSMPCEMTVSKNKLKENMLCRLCQVCLVKCRFAKTS